MQMKSQQVRKDSGMSLISAASTDEDEKDAAIRVTEAESTLECEISPIVVSSVIIECNRKTVLRRKVAKPVAR